MKILDAFARKPMETPPVWLMRQAGRYLPEYRKIREKHSFQESVRTPEIAAEITLQPIRRFGFDAAILFADIMTPLEAVGVNMTFDPGPRLDPMTLAEIADLPELQEERVGFVAETLRIVRRELPGDTALIGFAGAPVTVMAYLLEGGSSSEFMAMRAAFRKDPIAAQAAIESLGRCMNTYLSMQVAAGADVVQLFDTWIGALDNSTAGDVGLTGARTALAGLAAPRIYFAPHAKHLQRKMTQVNADGYGIDWREPISSQWDRIDGDAVVQGNLDPAVLLADPATIRSGVHEILQQTDGRPGFVFNLGHGIHKDTPIEHVTALVHAVRGET